MAELIFIKSQGTNSGCGVSPTDYAKAFRVSQSLGYRFSAFAKGSELKYPHRAVPSHRFGGFDLRAEQFGSLRSDI